MEIIMLENYTAMVNNHYFDLVDEEIISVWEDIENTPENTEGEIWKKKLNRIVEENSFSSRFALMRIISSRRTGSKLSESEPFKIQIKDEEYFFEDITCEHAKNLSAEEIKAYENVLIDMASQGDMATEADKFLIFRAFQDVNIIYEDAFKQKDKRKSRQENKALLNRSEALRLGHILGFSLLEMNWFLLRVFDFEDGFFYNSSEDIIEAYGFLTRASWQEVEKLHDEYKKIESKVVKKKEDAERIMGETREITKSLPELVNNWKENMEGQDSCFFKWLEEKSPILDVPSKTALCIYRKLAVYTYRLIPEGGFYESDIVAELDNNKLKTIPLKMQKKCKMPMRKDVIDCINRICSSEGEFDKIIEEVLFENGQVSEKRCKEISDCLMNANKELYTSAQDQAKAWRTISLSNNGHPKLIVARMPDEKKSRVQKILEGSLQVEKSDMLHLLWFLFNLSWLEHPICDTNELFNSLADYTETVKMVLDKALLPAFYPPHIMEQSMLLSIVESVSDAGSPADVYAEICESLIKTKGKKNKI